VTGGHAGHLDLPFRAPPEESVIVAATPQTSRPAVVATIRAEIGSEKKDVTR
jgi:hypothetical protein